MILVTGANGFVGSALVHALDSTFAGEVIGAIRRPLDTGRLAVPLRVMPDLRSNADWSAALQGVSVVVHAAARVHIARDTAQDPLREFRTVNTVGSLLLAHQAALRGVRHFVYVSSIKVNGDETLGRPFSVNDRPAPCDPYGVSKLEAELGLRRIADSCGMSLTIIRPPLVYGPGVKANFRRLMRWIKSGVPLPLGGIHNRRSLVAVENLADLVVTCVNRPAARNRTFLVSDGEDLSTTELVRNLAHAMGTRVRLVSVSPAALDAAARLMGRRDEARRLLQSLQVDIDLTRKLLSWTPPSSVQHGLELTAEQFAREEMAARL
jgi:UDP-glucose 4-epimerase